MERSKQAAPIANARDVSEPGMVSMLDDIPREVSQ